MRSCCARRTCTRWTFRERASGRARRSRDEQHSGAALEARRSGVQRAGRECERGEGTRDRGPVPRGAQHLPGVGYVRGLKGDDEQLDEAVEKGKKKFVGYELPGRTLGVIGLGAIGVEVANAAHLLGMRVLGFDPQITVQRAWQLSSGVEQALSLDDLFARRHGHRARAAARGHAQSGQLARLRLMRGRRRS